MSITFFFVLLYVSINSFIQLTLYLLINSIIEQLGGKQLVMQLLSHDDANVRYEALLAVQKLMVHNWYVY